MSSRAQDWNPKQYAKHASFVAELGKPVLELLEPKPQERILDLGCGDGVLTLEIVRRGGDVVGVDLSPEMVDAARQAGIDARCVDGVQLSFDCEFDAVFSNAALHWMSPPERAISGAWRALKPGGRFVGEFGGHGNVATIIEAIETELDKIDISVDCPWYFPTPDEYSNLLKESGFDVDFIDCFSRPTQLPKDVRGWIETFAKSYLNAIAEPYREKFLSTVVESLRDRLSNDEGDWFADYVRLRFSATRP